jgi:hypothetical protein
VCVVLCYRRRRQPLCSRSCQQGGTMVYWGNRGTDRVSSARYIFCCQVSTAGVPLKALARRSEIATYYIYILRILPASGGAG